MTLNAFDDVSIDVTETTDHLIVCRSKLAEPSIAADNVDWWFLCLVFVGRWQPREVLWPQVFDDFDKCHCRLIGPESIGIRHVNRCSTTKLIGPLVKGWSEMKRQKLDARKWVLTELAEQSVGRNEGGTDHFKRRGRAAAFRQIRAFQ